MKKWKINALIPFPLLQTAPFPADGGAPPQFEWASRVNPAQKSVAGIQIRLKQVQHDGWFPIHLGRYTEPVEIQLTLSTETALEALEKVDAVLESICDDLAFRLQLPIPIHQLEVIDVTEPVAVGDERECLIFPPPVGYAHPKFQLTTFLEDSETEIVPELRVDFSELDSRANAVIRWYHKVLAAQSESDKFIFLMICLEILCSDYVDKVKAPFKGPCGHEMTNCPTCNGSLERTVNGPTLKKYLVEELGMEAKTAEEAWAIRQMVHGANDLSQKKLSELPRVARALKASVVRGIAERLWGDQTRGPIIGVNGAGILLQVHLVAFRQIKESDLD